MQTNSGWHPREYLTRVGPSGKALERRECRIYQDQTSHFLSLPLQLLSHFKCDKSPKGKASNEIGALGLNRTNLPQTIGGHPFNAVWGSPAILAMRFQTIDRLIVTQISTELKACAMQEKRWVGATHSEGYQRRTLFFILPSNVARQSLHGRRLKHTCQGKTLAKAFSI